MAKKKKPTISLEGLDDVVFEKKLDISSAQSVLAAQKEAKSKAAETVPSIAAKESPVVETREEAPLEDIPQKMAEKPTAKKTPTKKPKSKVAAPPQSARGTFPPEDKKRASFNIPKNLHRAIKDYSYFNEIDMVEYIFEQLVKPDLIKKGYYPPKKRK